MTKEPSCKDEARVGQQGTLTRIWAKRGTRPRIRRDRRFTWAYLFGAICPARGIGAALVMPVVSIDAMNQHLAEISKCVSVSAIALLILDGAGWHSSPQLILPENIVLMPLPSYAPEVEFDTFLASNCDLALPDGRQRVVRHGHDPVRTIQTGIGPVKVQKPKARDRSAPEAGERIRFTSSILPKWARRTKSLDALLPALYLRGISAGDFQEVLTALLGKDAPNLSPAVIARLKGDWEDEYQRWQKRDLSTRRYVYVWADGVYLQARMEPQAECMLVLIGATPEGKKELIGFQTGMRESAQSWKELLVDLKARGLSIAPEVAVGDGALGFWKALDETFPSTRHQRCWLHKTLNVLDKFPKSVQPNAHKDLREIWLAPDRATAETAIAAFAEKYAPKYDKAVECLIKDRETLLTFFDFPADHWDQ